MIFPADVRAHAQMTPLQRLRNARLLLIASYFPVEVSGEQRWCLNRTSYRPAYGAWRPGSAVQSISRRMQDSPDWRTRRAICRGFRCSTCDASHRMVCPTVNAVLAGRHIAGGCQRHCTRSAAARRRRSAQATDAGGHPASASVMTADSHR